MIKLYAAPGACSLAPHIVLQELGLPHELRIVKWKDTAAREELKKINPTGQVPTILTEEGYVLSEGVAIMQYLISCKPNNLFPESGKARFKAFEWMNFIATTLHKGCFSPLFNPGAFSDDETHFEAVKRVAMARLKTSLQIIEDRFPNEGDTVLGKEFTVVDAYLFTVIRWSDTFKIDLSPYKKLHGFMQRMAKRPSVIAAMKAEGLL